MDLKNFFNILLLAISLTTILVTLISYIVFKLRLGSHKKGDLKDPLEGSFYRRFAPRIRQEFLDKQKKVDEVSTTKVTVKVKFVSLFVFLVMVVSGLLLFEDYFSYRKEISERVFAADNFRELVKKGFLKSYEYSPRVSGSEVNKRISANTFDQTSYFLTAFSNQKFCLVSTVRANRFAGDIHRKSLKKWKTFFERNKLNFEILSTVTSSSNCLMIYPHIHSFSRGQVAQIQKQVRPYLITGGFGIIDGLGGEVEESLLTTVFGKMPQSESSMYPSLVGAEKDYLWAIDGGSFLNWSPLDLNYSHIISDSGSIFSSDHNGKLIKENGKPLSRIIKNAKATWTSLDPIENPLSDLIFLNLFADQMKLPIFKIENFRKRKNGVSFVYEQNKQSDNLDSVKSIYKLLDGSWTLFTNDYNYQGIDIREKDQNHQDVAILTSPKHNFDKLDNRTAFNLVQGVRLKLEELNYSGVMGLTTYDNFFNEAILDSASQNKLTYLYGRTKEISYSPIFLSGLNFLLIPKMFKSSKELLEDTSISNIEDMKKTLRTRLRDTKLLGGLSIFDISSFEVNDYLYKNSLEEIIKELSEKPLTLSEVVGWRNLKENIRLSAVNPDGDLKIVLENLNDVLVSDFKIIFDGPKGREEFLIENIKGKEKIVLSPSSYRER